MRNLLIVFAVFFIFSCQPAQDNDLELLAQYLVGEFDSQEQALRDSSYYNIHLNVVPIWSDRGYEGRWLYVEQAEASQLDKPYRQRAYHLYVNDSGQYVSAIYLINDPLRFAGDFKYEDPLSSLAPDSLELKAGCEVVLTKTTEGFSGQTGAKTCPSELRGAAYATSKVELTTEVLTSWDQGFDASGRQVWGAEKGPYIFKRKSIHGN